MKTIVIACGAGAVSSALMRACLGELLRSHGVAARTVCCRCDQLRRYQERADLIVTSVCLPAVSGAPVLLGTPLITGQGRDRLEQDILNALGEGGESNGGGNNMNFQLAIDSAVTLAETPIWDDRIGKLYWTDLFSGDVNQFDPESGASQKWATGRLIGSAVPCESLGRVLVANEDGICLLDQATGGTEVLAVPEPGNDKNRLNDARVDAAGRVFVSSVAKTYGSGDYTPDQLGGFYMLDTDHKTLKTVVAGINQYNAICWNRDDTKMFVVDTYNQKLLCFDYDLERGPVSGPREVVDFAAQGMPDGMCIDEEDSLYVCHWTGRISVWDRDLKLKEEIPFPVEQVCCCGFGGRDMKDLYVATARFHYGEAELKQNPGAGGLFVARSDVRGRRDHFFH